MGWEHKFDGLMRGLRSHGWLAVAARLYRERKNALAGLPVSFVMEDRRYRVRVTGGPDGATAEEELFLHQVIADHEGGYAARPACPAGRPALGKEKRRAFIPVRLTEEEERALKRTAKSLSVKPASLAAAWVRAALALGGGS